MANHHMHDSATSNVLAWSSQAAHMQHEPEDEVAAESDEPPDKRTSQFRKRTTLRNHMVNPQSLLSKALHQSDDDQLVTLNLGGSPSRRRSMNSNISLASTADLTSDTGLTSPARTNTPSPPPQVFQLGRLNTAVFDEKLNVAHGPLGDANATATTSEKSNEKPLVDNRPKDSALEVLTKKRCISFACAAKPDTKKPSSLPKPTQTPPTTVTADKPAQRKTCIKFACSAKPTLKPNAEATRPSVPEVVVPPVKKGSSPSALRKHRSPSTNRSQRSLTPRRRESQSPIAVRSKKYLTVNPVELNLEASRFHEFASDEPQEDDWIRQNVSTTSARLTITDTLKKENEIRRIGKEAEEEAEQEEQEAELDNEDDADNLDDEDENEEVDADEEDDNEGTLSGYGSDDDVSDGYNTDNEVGFADSDDEDEAGDLDDLWTHGQAETLQLSGATPIIARRPSLTGNRSDSSLSDDMPNARRRDIRERSRRIRIRPGTPELPDSTDFVCGTLDEDRPLEDAYISCIAQRRREKLHLIPQDIDPSFPTSEPEDEDAEPAKAAHDSDDNVWIHGELEDLHHESDRTERRRKKGDHASPKRYHSPPPKRHHSPPPKARGRSPRRLFDRQSPRYLVSPPPSGRIMISPPASPQNTSQRRLMFKTLASRPGLTHTKSLPRAPSMFPNHLKGQRRRQAARTGVTGHVRGAIDIVKGLEQKRQRRKEKYVQKHCNRARKGQVHERRPQPGKGAERMRDIGLHIAGKIGHDPYVLSV